MMLPISPAAFRQIGLRIRDGYRSDRRETDRNQQQNRRGAPHRSIVQRGTTCCKRFMDFVGAGGEGRTLIPSEGCGILSPVRLPVPPLQQLPVSFEFTIAAEALLFKST